MSLRLDPTGVEASVISADGATRFRMRRRFDGPTVCEGRPALRAGGMYADHHGLRGEWADPVAKPRIPFPPYVPHGDTAGATPTSSAFRCLFDDGGRWWLADPAGRSTRLASATPNIAATSARPSATPPTGGTTTPRIAFAPNGRPKRWSG